MRKIIITFCFCATIFYDGTAFSQQSHFTDMFGNVSGWVKDQETGAPIKGASVYVLTSGDDPVDSARAIDKGIASYQENFEPKQITDQNGRFLINSVPTSDEGPLYSVLVEANGYRSYLIKNFAVPPGASLSFDFKILLKKGEGKMEVIEKSRINSIIFDRYGNNPEEDKEANMMEHIGISPNKDKVAFSHPDWSMNPARDGNPASFNVRYSLWVIDLTSDRARCLAGEDNDFTNLSRPSWSPDQSWLAFMASMPGGYSLSLWVVDTSGANLKQLVIPVGLQIMYHSPIKWKNGHTVVVEGSRKEFEDNKVKIIAKILDYDCETGTLKSEN
ncbi:MAG TPA: carboxypeptidase regulatory-like domain-containing protein [Candidatus Kryptonia bacterium]